MSEKRSRIIQLDIIRGFALLGILLVNMSSFHSPDIIKSYYGLPNNYQGLEKFISIFFTLFIQMKFYPIFAFLFGLGFYLFFLHTKRRTTFIKRMLFLLLLGLSHLVLIWHGDILHTYSICGLILLLFYRLPSRKILYCSIGLLSLYHFLLLVSAFLPLSSTWDSDFIANKISEYTTIYKEASYTDWLYYRFQVEVLPILNQLPITIIPILGSFLLGLYVGKKEMYIENEKNHHFITSCLKWTFMTSLPIVIVNGLILTSIIHIGQADQQLISHFFSSVSGLSLSIFYMSSLFILCSYPKWLKLLLPFGFVGKMALSNYLLQSIVSIGFYRLFHLYEKVDLIEGTLISLVIFSSQLVFSYFWLTYFHYGPAEWLWRTLTYGQIMPLKKGRKLTKNHDHS
ncbi:DUF418 domain-containing protein [Metabacillus sediminilitoris]|uniref:DUF418 domain-containing protein n=1 Tax=Metabacillus sediminilitoris TaxID=2567941 RepID=A0A4S4BN02_9BACI|nr:DUF418 domain-containing protein [Metabacillus sediminilitoris]QGQ46533.1 DUF418 domain-containing protein [Metabacillus sediminilitoris]THF75300.1 DUF418 domain-containing protein [Metabacillus sediminilitoris]